MYNHLYPYLYDFYGNYWANILAVAMIVIVALYVIFSLSALILCLISKWILYKKAGKSGWESIIPVYNDLVLIQIVGLPLWYIILLFIPIADIYAKFRINIELAYKFGKTASFGVLTTIFPQICIPILALGNSQYDPNRQSFSDGI